MTPKGKELFAVEHKLKCDFHPRSKPIYWSVDMNKIPNLINFYMTKELSDNYICIENEEGLIRSFSCNHDI